jgi:RimJ/RimL family protein N-acetyltransferase
MFNGMKKNRIIAFVHRDNIALQRIAEKCGLKHEATLREIWYQHGNSRIWNFIAFCVENS